jgi:hypothetical protein
MKLKAMNKKVNYFVITVLNRLWKLTKDHEISGKLMKSHGYLKSSFKLMDRKMKYVNAQRVYILHKHRRPILQAAMGAGNRVGTEYRTESPLPMQPQFY